MNSFALTYGPILFGGAVALMLSGIVAAQCIIFFKLYPDESGFRTVMVATVWTLDVTQSGFIVASLFDYFIAHFGDTSILAFIPGSIALTILLTAAQTCVVHLCSHILSRILSNPDPNHGRPRFYAQKIHRSSGRNWLITAPIVCLASLRLLAAIAATVEMLRLGRWDAFSHPYPRLLFTSGLSLSAGTDMIITICLCYYLRKIRKLSSSSVMNGVLDTLTLYTLENGLITCLATIGSLTFWLVLPASSLSLSLHFVIGKLYPNSFLILLNTRKELRDMHSGDQGIHIDPSKHLASYYTEFPHRVPIAHRIDRFPPHGESAAGLRLPAVLQDAPA
ncbi:Glycoside hydrolase [Mycena venus]|uniref:Glycoside hydrolase n=1 Tax=Mycena venus TaxID=2733690 RepID=A0A8H7D6L0_9AGAR|nr:Glycoside hydrolase [Mycena venus]